MHAYCISTHRSQGSEYPAVVMPILTQHYMMLQRNLLYTAITRAKQLVILVGTRQALHIAVSNNKVAERHSGLLQRLHSLKLPCGAKTYTNSTLTPPVSSGPQRRAFPAVLKRTR